MFKDIPSLKCMKKSITVEKKRWATRIEPMPKKAIRIQIERSTNRVVGRSSNLLHTMSKYLSYRVPIMSEAALMNMTCHIYCAVHPTTYILSAMYVLSTLIW